MPIDKDLQPGSSRKEDDLAPGVGTASPLQVATFSLTQLDRSPPGLGTSPAQARQESASGSLPGGDGDFGLMIVHRVSGLKLEARLLHRQTHLAQTAYVAWKECRVHQHAKESSLA